MKNTFESKLWALLEKRKLADLSQFHQPGFFDEVPLYSRAADVDFLPKGQPGDLILLGFSLKYLQALVGYERHPAGYFAAVTFWDFSDEHLVPNVFAWCGPPEQLKRRLILRAPFTPFGKRIAELVSKLPLTEQYDSFEDPDAEAGTTRVFVGPRKRPYPGFLPLYRLHQSALKT